LNSDNNDTTAAEFEPSPTQSPSDWVIAVTERTAALKSAAKGVGGDGGEGFGGRLARSRKTNATDQTTVFDPFIEAEAGKQVHKI
jgi:hypothetical protein